MAKLDEIDIYLKLHDKVTFGWNVYFTLLTTVMTAVAVANHEHYSPNVYYRGLFCATVVVFALMDGLSLHRAYSLLEEARDALKVTESSAESGQFTDSIVAKISEHKSFGLTMTLVYVAGIAVLVLVILVKI
jgi:hypothetical protein